MVRKSGPGDDDYDNAARLGLLGLTAEEDADVDPSWCSWPRCSRNNTVPAEVLVELAAEAIEESGASPADPILLAGPLG